MSANTTVRSGGTVTYAVTPKLVKVGVNYTYSSSLTSFVNDGEGVNLGIGESYRLSPDVRPVNALPSFAYESADKSVAVVDKYGRITATGLGETFVTVSSGNIKSQFKVVVGESGEAQAERA